MKYKVYTSEDGEVKRKLTLRDDEIFAVMGVIGLTCQNDRKGLLPSLEDIPQKLFSQWSTAEGKCFPGDSPYHLYRPRYTGTVK